MSHKGVSVCVCVERETKSCMPVSEAAELEFLGFFCLYIFCTLPLLGVKNTI